MTATSPIIHVRTHVRRMIGHVGAIALAASVLCFPVALTPAFAAAADEEPKPTVTLEVAPSGSGSIAPGSGFAASISLNNDTKERLTEGVLTVAIDRTPLPDDAALESWLDVGTAQGVFDAIVTQPSEPVPAGDTFAASALVPAAALGILPPGVYPLRATLTGATTGSGPTLTSWELDASAVVVVQSAKPAAVSVLVPITATPKQGGLLTAEELTGLTAPDGRLTAQLDGVEGSSAVLAIDPSIPAAIRVLGSSAPASATQWLARLDTMPNDRFALQFGDADAATQAHAGLDSLLAPPSLAALMDPASITPASPTPTPSSTPGETAPVLPDNTELSAVSGAVPGILWPRGDVTDDDLATFRQYLGDDVTTVLPDTALSGEKGARADAKGRAVLVTDTGASSRLSEAVVAADPTARDREIAAATGHLFFDTASAPDAPLLIGLDRSESRGADDLAAVLSAVATSPSGLSGLLAATTAPVESTAKADASRATALRSMLDDETRLQSFSSILDDPLVLLTPERIQVLRIIGVGVSDGVFPERVATHRTQTIKTLGAVGIQKPSPIQLFTSAAPLPVWVRNDLPWPVSLTLTTQPSDARLYVQQTTPVRAGPASNTRVTVPVEARVASGELEVEFRLTSPTGVPIGLPASANVTVRADWEGIGLGILGSVIALLLGVGVWRTVVRRRRARVDTVEQADATKTDAAEQTVTNDADASEQAVEKESE